MAVSAEVATLFLEELARRNVPVKLGEEGGYEIQVGELTATVQLENVSRDFARDRDPARIANFVDTILSRLEIPSWEAAEPRLRWSLEPSDSPLDDVLHDVLSDQVALVLVHVSADETQVMWVTDGMAEKWGQTKKTILAAATANVRALLAEAKITTTPVDEHTLGMVETEYTAFKAALVLCPGLKELAEPVLGWPLFAVLPTRDFVYLVPEKDREVLPRLGPVVVREYEESGYPLSTEVFELTDEGLRAIAEFQRPPRADEDDEPEIDEDGLKTIRYRGGVVVFRVPAHWVEEYDEGGGTFYDEDEDNGTFRLSTLLLSSKNPVTTHTAREMAESRAAKQGGAASDLGGGNWLTEYVQESEEDGEPLTIRYWEIVNPVPPNHLRVAVFSYTVRTELLALDDAAVGDELETVAREVQACTFAPTVGE